ncbi:MAG: KilA-N domain-containing protein [Bacillota bacterium]|nr:KilA-N domain-containing protein [Bacillota bacterium]
MTNKEVEVQGFGIRYKKANGEDYICITDMAKAKNPKHTGLVIAHWLRTISTIQYLGLWESLNNPDFNVTEFGNIRSQAGENSFVLTAQDWIEKTGAIGLISSTGRYGGTYAHKDIAFKFASWISVEFELYLIKEFQRLKAEEAKGLEWDSKRELAKVNYRIHTDAIKENIVPTLTEEQLRFVYADEADLLNVALFGMTAGQWRKLNPEKKGNMRDYASIHQLLVIANMESYNAILIEQKLPQRERLLQLNAMARSQLRVLERSDSKLLLENNEKD